MDKPPRSPNKSPLEELVSTGIDYQFAKYLDTRSIVSLSGSSSVFGARTKGLVWWREKLLSLGCDRAELKEILASHTIQNPAHLYHALHKIPLALRGHLSAWSICSLSGERSAIDWAQEHAGLSAASVDAAGRNPLHYLALGGTVDGFEYGRGLFDIAADSVDAEGLKIMHYAALSQSDAMLDHCMTRLGFTVESVSNVGAGLVHYSAQSGSLSTLRRSIETYDLDVSSIDLCGQNILFYAAFGGSPDEMVYCVNELKMDVNHQNTNGMNVLLAAVSGGFRAAVCFCRDRFGLSIEESKDNNNAGAVHYAALSGSTDLMRFLLDELAMSPRCFDIAERSPLHYAVISGSPAMITLLRSRGLDPYSADTEGHDAFWYARERSKFPEEALAALRMNLMSVAEVKGPESGRSPRP